MPELPEVETVKRGLESAMLGKSISRVHVHRHDLRFPIPRTFDSIIKDQQVNAIIRRGKYILTFMKSGDAFVLHLGMSGRIHIMPANRNYEIAKHDHVVFEFEDGMRAIFNDPRRFGRLYLTNDKGWQAEKPFNTMGPEPLAGDFTGTVLAEKISGRRAPIKTILLDQNVVAGIGNIYACEALFDSGIDPRRQAVSIRGKEAARLVDSIKDVLTRAIAAGGSSLKDYAHTDGSPGYFQTSFSVYDREGQRCPGCTCGKEVKNRGIERIIQAGRSTFYCARRQT